MLTKRPTRISRSRIALSALALACALSAAAEAGPRGAPIIYKGDKMNASSPVRIVQTPAPIAAPAAKPVPVNASVDRATARIEFRYPDSAAGKQVQTASVTASPVMGSLRDNGYTEAPQIVTPRQPVVEMDALQPMPQPAGQGSAYTAAVPAAQPVAAPTPNEAFAETGIAVVYGEEFNGLPTANGEIFSQTEMTAAHPSLPLPSLVHVTNPATGREVVVRVNDRGPFEDGANLQLSRKAADVLGLSATGKGNVQVRYLSAAPVLAVAPAAAATPVAVKAPVPVAQSPTQIAAAPVVAEDELLGGGPSAVPTTPRLMSMTVVPAAQPSGDVFVQLASFSDIGNAEAMVRQVRGSLPVEIVPARVNGADFFRVRVGPFQDQASAEQVRYRLSADGTADGRIVTGS